MGKAVPKSIKSRAEYLLENFKEKFSTDFEKNKTVINGIDLPLSKVDRNIMAGYISRIIENTDN